MSRIFIRDLFGRLRPALTLAAFTLVLLASSEAQMIRGPFVGLQGKGCQYKSDAVTTKVFAEYGAIFSANTSVKTPPICIFASEQDVRRFQSTLDTRSETIGGVRIELQSAAMDALIEAVDEAALRGMRITPLDGEIAGKRTFADTVRIWNSRFLPALDYWIRRGRITRDDAESAKTMNVPDQLRRVLEWEAEGIYFSTGKNRPIMSSVAPPGTSQHLSLLAFDIEQSGNRQIREILNRNGWYQTVINDTPHFTYIGVAERELPTRGLISTVKNGYKFWTPKVD